MTKPLTIFGTPEQGAVDQINAVLADERAVAGALMADNHVGYSMPIGGVVAYDNAISPTGVGFDIGCGNMAAKTNLNIFSLGVDESSSSDGHLVPVYEDFKKIMREIQKKVSFGLGRANDTPVDDPVLDDSSTWREIDVQFGKELRNKARQQIGTVGSGNHYVDVLVDESGYIWTANHFGSRGLGHTIASGFMAAAAGLSFTERVPESEDAVVLDMATYLGDFYAAAMNLAGKYAYAGREYVTQQVLDILGAEAVETVHNHHNFAWLENGLWIVRKGATPLTSKPAFIGGSMGDISVIVRGKSPLAPGNEYLVPSAVEDIGNLGSAPHGAGRVMSRTQAAGKMRKMWVCQNRKCGWRSRAEAGNGRRYISNGEVIDLRECPSCGEKSFKKIRARDVATAAINWDDARADLKARGIVVLGAGADESPGVYKDLATVLAAHKNIEILHTLRPLGVVMAGDDTFDPYKD